MSNQDSVEAIYEVVVKKLNKLVALTKATDEFGDSAEDANKKSKGASSGITKMATALKAAAVAAAAVKIAKIGIELGEVGAKAQFVEKNFSKFAKNAGRDSVQMMNDLRNATQGFIGDMELQQFAMQSLISGINFDDMTVAMEYTSRFAMATGKNVAQSMQTVMTGLARGSAQFLDDVGIQVMGAEDVVGSAVDQMKQKMDSFADAGGTPLANIQQTKIEFENAKNTLSQHLIPATISWFNTMSDILKKAKDITTALGFDKLEREQEQAMLAMQFQQGVYYRKVKKAGVTAVEDVMDKYRGASRELNELTKGREHLSTSEGVRRERELKSYIDSAKSTMESMGFKSYSDTVEAMRQFNAMVKKNSAKKVDTKTTTKTSGKAEEKKEIVTYNSWLLTQLEERIKKGDELEAKAKAKRRSDIKTGIDEELAEKNRVIDIIADREMARLDAEYQSQQENQQKIQSLYLQSGQSIAKGINAVSQAKQRRLRQEANDEIRAIQQSNMSQKKKQEMIAKVNEKSRAEMKKTATLNWAIDSVASGASLALASINMMRDSKAPSAGVRIAQGIATAAGGAAWMAQVAASKPKFYNGGKMPWDNNNGDGQLAMLRGGERVLTPYQNTQYENNTNSTTSSNTVNMYVTVNGGNPDDVVRAVESGVSRAMQNADRNNEVDYNKMPNLNNHIRALTRG